MILLCLLLGQDVRGELEKLSSADLEVRQAAEAALVAMGEAAIPEIERLAAAADVETRGRAADVVRRLRWWDHAVFWRGRKVDLRRGDAAPSEHGAQARVAGGRVLDVTSGAARAVDLRTGRELWKADLAVERGGHEWFAVETGDGSVVIRTMGGVACVGAADGRVLWTVKGDASLRVAPVAGGDWLVRDARGVSRKGSTSWTVQVPGPDFVAAAGPWALVSGGTLTRILDIRDGTELRTIDTPRVHRAVDAGEGRVLLVRERSLVARRTSDAAVLWTKPDVGEASHPLVEGRRVYVADHHRMCCSIKLYALDVETGAPLWIAPATGIPTEHSKYRHEARLARVGPYLVLLGEAAAGDYVEAFDPATGARVSRWSSN